MGGRVLSVASECVPLVKTGGLADVVGALPGALVPTGWDMRVLLPAYRGVRAQAKNWPVVWEEADLWGGPGRVLAGRVAGVPETWGFFPARPWGGGPVLSPQGGPRHEAERMGEPFLGEVPLHMSIRENSDAGRPVVAVAPDSAEAKIYLDIARKVRARLEGGAGRAAPRIVVD